MMSRIKLLVHLEVVSSGGTIHHFRHLLKYIDRDKFDVYFATTCGQGGPDRYSYLDEFKKLLDPAKILIYPYRTEVAGWHAATNTYNSPPDNHELYQFIADNNIQIMYGERAGEANFPYNKKIPGCKIIATNIFAGHDPNNIVDYEILISQGVFNDWSKKASPDMQKKSDIISLFIDEPETLENNRNELGIADDVFVVGRIGNVYVGDTENMHAYIQLEKQFGSKVACVWLNPSDNEKEMALQADLKNITFLPLCTSYLEKSKIINTFDVFAHDRAESFGAAIAECIMHKKPVITTETNSQLNMNTAHTAFFNDNSYLAGRGDSYFNKLKWLYELSPASRAIEGQKFYDFNYDKIAAKVLIKKVEDVFEKVL
jgi:hypothetical protein